MEEAVVIAALSALAQESRLLVTAGPEGMAAGQIAEEVGRFRELPCSHLILIDSSIIMELSNYLSRWDL